MRKVIVIPCLLIIITLLFYKAQQDYSSQVNGMFKTGVDQEKQLVTMNVFIHGSFGTALGLLSLPSVIDDHVRGSYYREANKRIRTDSFFYKDQVILDRGLVPITPSFDLASTGQKLYAAYPVTKAYQSIADWLIQDDPASYATSGREHYYTFGWTGLLSQTSRRFEAIRLYNALVEEKRRLSSLGFYPKIRLITHSHGGNLALNLAGIQAVLQLESFDLPPPPSTVNDYKGAIAHIFQLIKELSSQDDALKREGQKQLDYVPTDKFLEIEELILYGCPIQPETIGFCCSPLFKKIYNFYSGEDVIQRVDWVTTYRHYSDQRIDHTFFDQESWSQIRQKIYQIKLMIGREWREQAPKQAENGVSSAVMQPISVKELISSTMRESDQKVLQATPLLLEQTNKLAAQHAAQEKKNTGMSWWDFLFASKQAFSRISQDPTHKELWYCSWQKEGLGSTVLNPLPLVVLTPLFLALVKNIKNYDLDINLKLSLDTLTGYVAVHDTDFFITKKDVPRALIEELKAKTLMWCPKETTLSDEFNAVYRHLL